MVDFLRWLPVKEDADGRVALKIWEIDPRHPSTLTGRCRKWDDEVQPLLAREPNRPDSDWSWRLIAVAAFGLGARRTPRIFQLTVGADDRPAAMIAVLANERWVQDLSKSATFLWYLSSAPEDFLMINGNNRTVTPKMVGRAGLDAAVTVALNSPTDGRLWLHAAPEGGERLSSW